MLEPRENGTQVYIRFWTQFVSRPRASHYRTSTQRSMVMNWFLLPKSMFVIPEAEDRAKLMRLELILNIAKRDLRTLKSTFIFIAASTYLHWNDFSLQEKLLTKSNYQMQASFKSLLGFWPSGIPRTAALVVFCATQEVTAHSSASQHLSPPWSLRLSAQIWKNLPYGSSNPKFN